MRLRGRCQNTCARHRQKLGDRDPAEPVLKSLPLALLKARGVGQTRQVTAALELLLCNGSEASCILKADILQNRKEVGARP